jgi:dienelactone hydrolase
MRRALPRGLPALLAVAALFAPAAAQAFDSNTEAANFSKLTERERYITLTPEFQSLAARQILKGPLDKVAQIANDPERLPANLCTIQAFECAGDVRFYDWGEKTGGIQRSVVFTARSGATISGTIWAAKDGPAARPGIVITTGSVQAPEELYWGQAATLAKHGYVVLTYDVQGQGNSDTLGELPDLLEGVPSQAGEPFFDGTEDALDFLTSTPAHPYEPRNSCTTGTSHAPKQDRRVAAGKDTAYNPAFGLLDASRIGIAGHSLGAAAVSYVGQEDPRVDATVAWDNLEGTDGKVTADQGCASAPDTRTERNVTKPAMGISNDYGIVPVPFGADPDPQEKNKAFLGYRSAGVDSAEVTIRGGCHEESAFIPGLLLGPYPLGCGSLRGGDMLAWYTTAWFDKYVKGDTSADKRLTTDRWRNDAQERAIDPLGDPSVLSFYFRSRFDFGRAGGGRAVCDDMRAGCPSMGPDGEPPDYSFLTDSYGPVPPPPGALPETRAKTGKRAAALRKCKKKKAKKSKRARKKCRRKARRLPA